MELVSLDLAVHRLRDAEAALDAARADAELEAVAALRRGGDVEAICALSGLNPHDLLRLEKLTGDIPAG
ncbi:MULTISPECIES: hypothetical protein [Streptomyces]|uniref:hypothetical protein n=1 Tax=Streptomyces TaxID=1883 RepID=UPI001422C000|nr:MULTISPECIES: hypothetical protein [Streptomyces]GHB53920.1 hypothetical protein GCM10010331_46840 [Streptomyces xanthochromogenes]